MVLTLGHVDPSCPWQCKNVYHYVVKRLYVKLEELLLCDVCISVLCYTYCI